MLLSGAGCAARARSAAGRPTFVPFDIILLDPPYEASDADDGVLLRRRTTCRAAAACVVLEHARRQPAPDTAGGVSVARAAGAVRATARCRSTNVNSLA